MTEGTKILHLLQRLMKGWTKDSCYSSKLKMDKIDNEGNEVSPPVPSPKPMLTYDDLAQMVIARYMGKRVEGDEGSDDEEGGEAVGDVALEKMVEKLIKKYWDLLDPSCFACFPDSDISESEESDDLTVVSSLASSALSSACEAKGNSGERETACPGGGAILGMAILSLCDKRREESGGAEEKPPVPEVIFTEEEVSTEALEGEDG